MARVGRRRRIAANIYEDGSGIAAVVRVKGRSAELRFPAGTPLVTVRRDMQAKADEIEELAGATALRGSLRAVCEAHLGKAPAAERKEREQLLQPWIDAFGDVPWWSVTRAQLQSEAKRWRATLSAARVNKRISALRVAWQDSAPDHGLVHGVERLKRFTEPQPITRGAPLALIQSAIDTLPDTYIDHARRRRRNRAKLRLAVLLWTGQPPSRLKLVERSHLRLQATPPEMYVMPRRKGTGSADAWLPLLPQAVEALAALVAADGLGPFETRPLARTWERAKKARVRALIEAGAEDDAATLRTVRLYDLRHSFAAALAAETGDLYATAEYLGHSNLQTTRRYVRGAAKARMAAGIVSLAAAHQVPRISATGAPADHPQVMQTAHNSEQPPTTRVARKSRAV